MCSVKAPTLSVILGGWGLDQEVFVWSRVTGANLIMAWQKKNLLQGVPVVAQRVMNLIRIYEDPVLTPDPAEWVKDPVLLRAAA